MQPHKLPKLPVLTNVAVGLSMDLETVGCIRFLRDECLFSQPSFPSAVFPAILATISVA